MDDGGLLGGDGGVQIRPPNYEKFSRVERVIAVPYYKEHAYWDFLKAQVGKPYNKLAIVALPSIVTGACRMHGSAMSWLRPDSNVVRKLTPCVNRLDPARLVFSRECDCSGGLTNFEVVSRITDNQIRIG